MTTRPFVGRARVPMFALVCAAVLLAAGCRVQPERPNPVSAQGDADVDVAGRDDVVRYDTPPRRLNSDEAARMLQRGYPRNLLDAGIGGTAHVWAYVDTRGRVVEARIHESTGHAELDALALRIAELIRYAPALYEGDPVAVWVLYPVTFRAR